MTLEIKIKDTITIKDGLPEAVEYLVEEIRKWYESDEKAPLHVALSKVEDRGPPVLNINVKDKLNIKSILG